MRYYKLTYKNRMLPGSTLAQDTRTYAPESMRRHLLRLFRGMADNPAHVRVDIATDRLGVPVNAIVWHKLVDSRTGMWTIWERVRIVRV